MKKIILSVLLLIFTINVGWASETKVNKIVTSTLGNYLESQYRFEQLKSIELCVTHGIYFHYWQRTDNDFCKSAKLDLKRQKTDRFYIYPTIPKLGRYVMWKELLLINTMEIKTASSAPRSIVLKLVFETNPLSFHRNWSKPLDNAIFIRRNWGEDSHNILFIQGSGIDTVVQLPNPDKFISIIKPYIRDKRLKEFLLMKWGEK